MGRKILILLFLFGFQITRSENYFSNDAGFWGTLTLQKNLTRRLSLGFDQEIRLRENYQRLNLFYSNIGLAYKLNKNFKTEISYRSIEKYRLDYSVSFRHRLMFDLTGKFKTNQFMFFGRFRYQTEVQDFYSSRKGKIPENFIRLKGEVKANMNRRYSPYFSAETRFQITSPRGRMPDYNMGFHRIRYMAGIEYEINKRNLVNIYYLFQTEFGIYYPENIYILGLQYVVSL